MERNTSFFARYFACNLILSTALYIYMYMVFVGFEYLMEIHVSEVGRPSKNNEGEGSKHYHQRGHCWQHNPHRSFEMCYESYESKIHSGRQSSGSEVRRAMADFVGMLAQWCAELSLL